MSAFLVAKAGAQILAGLGVSRVVAQIIQNNTAVVTTADKVLVPVGSLVLGLVVVDHTSNRVNYAFDKFADWSEKRKDDIEDVVETVEEKIDEKRKKNGNF